MSDVINRIGQPIGTLYNRRTDAETSAGVTPVDYRYPEGHLKRYGAEVDGTTDDSTARDNAAAVCEVAGVAMISPAGTAKMNSAFTYAYQKYSIIGEPGAVWDFSDSTAGYQFKVEGDNTASVTALYGASTKRVYGMRFVGAKTTGMHCVSLGDTAAAVKAGANTVFEGCVFRSWDTILTWGSNAYLNLFRDCQFSDCNKAVSYPSGLTNSGENVRFEACALFNSTALLDIAGGGYFNLHHCSLDYFDEYAVSAAGGANVRLKQCFLESDSDGDNWLKCASASTTSIRAVDCTYIVTGDRTNHLFSGGTSNGGIYIDGYFFSRSNTSVEYTPQTLGAGNVYTKRRMTHDNSDPFRGKPASEAQNILVDGGFSGTLEALLQSDWRAVNSDRTGLSIVSGELKLVPPTGEVIRLHRAVAVSPGAKVNVSYKTRHVISDTDDACSVKVQYYTQYGASPSSLSASARTLTYDTTNEFATLTEQVLGAFAVAPEGAAYALVSIETAAGADGSAEYYFDDFIIEVEDSTAQQLGYQSSGTSVTQFTPVVYGASSAGAGTYTIQWGRYTLIGDRCFFTIELAWTAHTGTGEMKVGGLPIVSNFGPNFAVSLSAEGFAFTGPVLSAYVEDNTNDVKIRDVPATGTATTVSVPAAGTLRINGHYQVK